MVKISYLVHYYNLLQNATDIVTKCEKSLLQNVSGFLLQNATVLLQNATVITNSDIYYKMRRYKKFYSFHGSSVCKKISRNLSVCFKCFFISFYM